MTARCPRVPGRIGRRSRPVGFVLSSLLGVGIGLGGCGSKSQSVSGNLEPTDAEFSVCSGTPAVHFAPGMSVRSTSGAYNLAIESAVTTLDDETQIPIPGIGVDTFAISVTAVTDGGVDAAAGGAAPAGLDVTSTMLPWMPVHMHGASSLPTVTAQSGGFNVAGLGFFMGGYWQVPLNLIPAGGTPDTATFSICIPDD
ncbi:MAG TPA: hypothetical protein VFG23_11625 [Polyangia bacterium]|nr:hypothetical protein [Polyangia bacterium]